MRPRFGWRIGGKGFGSSVLAGIAAAAITIAGQIWFETMQEKRRNTQDFVMLFHSSVMAGHRDSLARFALEPAMQAVLRGDPERPAPSEAAWADRYATALQPLLDRRVDALISATALTDFFLDVRTCVRQGRCSDDGVTDAFGRYAQEFYNVFFPVVRQMDCATGHIGSVEDSLLALMRDPEPIGGGCNVFRAAAARLE